MQISSSKTSLFQMKSFKTNIAGLETDFVFHQFRDKSLLIITQYQKMANIFLASSESNSDVKPPENNQDDVTVQCRFGQDTDELRVAIKQIYLRAKLKNESVISLALKEQISKKILDEIVDVLKGQIVFP